MEGDYMGDKHVTKCLTVRFQNKRMIFWYEYWLSLMLTKSLIHRDWGYEVYNEYKLQTFSETSCYDPKDLTIHISLKTEFMSW